MVMSNQVVATIIDPKKPKGDGWVCAGKGGMFGFDAFRWWYPKQGLLVVSAVEVANDPNDIEKGPEYHISISKEGCSRCTRNEARFVCKAFGMLDAEEDNHVPGGFVRNYWLPVNENLIGHECRCKDEEPAMIEDKGDFIWRGAT